MSTTPLHQFRRQSTLAITGIALMFGCYSVAAAKREYSVEVGAGEVCQLAQGFLNSGRSVVPREFTLLNQPLEHPSAQLPEGAKGQQVADFDFDNDGSLDQVFAQDDAGSYQMGTTLYVQHGAAKRSLKATPQVSDLAIYPCQFDPTVKQSASCPPLAQEADEATVVFHPATDAKAKRAIAFRVRYVDITPVRYQKMTYLVLVSNSGDTRKYAAVIMPKPKNAYESLCLLKAK